MPNNDNIKPLEVEGPTEHERHIPRGPLYATVGTVGALLLGALVLLPFYGRSEYHVGMYDAHAPVTVVHFKQDAWVPAGPTTKLPDTQMVAVGQTEEGYFLYVDRTLDGGGGGGAPLSNQPPQAYHHVYVRTATDHYLPLKYRERKRPAAR